MDFWSAGSVSLISRESLILLTFQEDRSTFIATGFLFVCLHVFIFERQRETEHEWGGAERE